MLGIDLNGGRGLVAVLRDRRPVVIGEGRSFAELAVFAVAQLGPACLETTSVVTVPAWFNDEQRKEVVAQARAAGLLRVRLMNSPTAAAMAHAALDPAEWSTVLVIDAAEDRFDVSLMRNQAAGFEILAVNGRERLEAAVMSDPDAFGREVGSVVVQVLKEGRVVPGGLGAVLVVGESAMAEDLRKRMSDLLGLEVSSAVPPGEASALGAAVQAGLFGMEAGAAPASAAVAPGRMASEGAPSRRGGGCTGVLAIGILILIAIWIGSGGLWIWMS